MQFIERTPLTDRRIWDCMKRGYYGKGKQEYAKKVESIAEKLPKRQSHANKSKQILDSLFS